MPSPGASPTAAPARAQPGAGQGQRGPPSPPIPSPQGAARQGRGAGSVPARVKQAGPAGVGRWRWETQVGVGGPILAVSALQGSHRRGSLLCRNRASIDLLLLKPERLSGTLPPSCPRTPFLERSVLCALGGRDRPPTAPGRGSGPRWVPVAGRAGGTGAGEAIPHLAPTAPPRSSSQPPLPPALPARPARPALPTGLRAALSPHHGRWWQRGLGGTRWPFHLLG